MGIMAAKACDILVPFCSKSMINLDFFKNTVHGKTKSKKDRKVKRESVSVCSQNVYQSKSEYE